MKKVKIKKSQLKQAVKKVLKQSKTGHVVNLGPGVELQLRPSGDFKGLNIMLQGTFRPDAGMYQQQVAQKIKRFWKQIDVDRI